MKRSILAGLAGSLAIGTLVGGSLLAQGTRESDPAIRQGFSSRYVVVETKDHEFVLLDQPYVRALGNRTYLVGRFPTETPSLENNPFTLTTQWVCLEDIRRMGEVQTHDELKKVISSEHSRRQEEAERSAKLSR